MKERGILFNSEMARAARSGQKTETRRGMTPQPIVNFTGEHSVEIDWLGVRTRKAGGRGFSAKELLDEFWDGICNQHSTNEVLCPFGKVGDRLYVREPYYQYGHWEPKGDLRTRTGQQKWHFVPDDEAITFDPPEAYRRGRHREDPFTPVWHKRLARFMPRKYSRTLLEITAIRAEQLQDISEEGAIAEGIEFIDGTNVWKNYEIPYPSGWFYPHRPIDSFRTLWDSVYRKKHPWGNNDWVWVIKFKVIHDH